VSSRRTTTSTTSTSATPSLNIPRDTLPPPSLRRTLV
jgi:hypothetical protein